MKINSRGFGVVEGILIVAIIGLLGFVAYKAYENSTTKEADNSAQIIKSKKLEPESTQSETRTGQLEGQSIKYTLPEAWVSIDKEVPTTTNAYPGSRSLASYKITLSSEATELGKDNVEISQAYINVYNADSFVIPNAGTSVVFSYDNETKKWSEKDKGNGYRDFKNIIQDSFGDGVEGEFSQDVNILKGVSGKTVVISYSESSVGAGNNVNVSAFGVDELNNSSSEIQKQSVEFLLSLQS